MTNKETILAFYQAVFNDHKPASDFVSADFVEHHTAPMEKAGVEAFYDRYAKFFAVEGATVEIASIVAEGDKVAAYIKMDGTDGHTFCRATDIFRLSGGKIVWHTATIQPVA